jgi:hypothetical protein
MSLVSISNSNGIEGCRNATVLYEEIRDKGYRGKRSMVARFVASWRKNGRPTRPKPPHGKISSHGAYAVLAGTDFFTVEVLTWRGLTTYYVLFSSIWRVGASPLPASHAIPPKPG